MSEQLTEGGSADALANPRTKSVPEPPSRAKQVVTIRKAALFLFAAAIFSLALTKTYHYLAEGRFFVSTDDAYVRADISTLAARVSGHITSIHVDEDQFVEQNDLIAVIDPVDYQLAVDSGAKKIKTQDAIITRIAKQIEGQAALVAQARAQLSAAQADAQRSAYEHGRAAQLVSRGYGTRQRLEQAQADRARTMAGVSAAEAALAWARANEAILEAQKKEANSIRDELTTSLARAEHELNFTQVRAPFAGMVGNKAIQLGQYVQPGTRLLAIVPLSAVYIDANFKETQLREVRPGQPVHIWADAFATRMVRGKVESIAPATGSQFSLIPPENATGNFTKITQRVPVRIAISSEDLADRNNILRPGMSVTVDVDTRAAENNEVAAAIRSRQTR